MNLDESLMFDPTAGVYIYVYFFVIYIYDFLEHGVVHRVYYNTHIHIMGVRYNANVNT